MRVDSAQQPIAEFHHAIADPDVFSGGGSVAAIGAAGAAATALLVMRLSLNRRVNQEQRSSIETSIRRTKAMIGEFHALADADIASLNVLLAAQRALKTAVDSVAARSRYQDALAGAARSPLEIGEIALELLRLIDVETSRAARFTISDLGAAAALLDGAVRAAALTSEVNLALLREAGDEDDTRATHIDAHRSALLRDVTALAQQIEATTRARIHRHATSRQV